RVAAAGREERARLVDAAETDQAARAQDVRDDPVALERERLREVRLGLGEAAGLAERGAEAEAGELVLGMLRGERRDLVDLGPQRVGRHHVLPFESRESSMRRMREVRRTACTRDCPDACSMLVTVEDGRAVRLQGDPGDPITRGFLCERTSRFLDRQY